MNSFHEQHKKWYALFLLCAAIAGLSGYYAFSDTKLPASSDSNVEQTEIHEKDTEKSNEIKNKENLEIVKNKEKNTNTPKETEPESSGPTQTNEISTTEPTPSTKEEAPATQEPPQKDLLTVTLKIPGATYTTKVPKESSVLALMNIVKAEQGISFQTKDFGGDLGLFIETMSGIKNGDKREHYWIYYINGAKAQIGISNYILKNNDIITWKYEAFEI